MIEEPKLEVIVDEFGHATYRMSHNGFLLDKEQAEYVAERIKRLEQENKKLRELVRDMFEEIEDSDFDPYVERQGKRGPYYEEDPSWRVKIMERVRELGIEVDE